MDGASDILRPGAQFKGRWDFVGDKEMGCRSEGISRRRFLTNTLGGTGAFLASVTLYPMVRFSADPFLKREEEESVLCRCRPRRPI